ncbi:MAG: P-II family nitrogen regulator [Oscillospiraceae bacterium]|jgi:nitrogen regulatory protein P-II 1|nr:P-II family nitrogen regulator [Oscillospiraceae bacterium]MCI2034850.1 P-II family nitrogen regulator [Oscillospiraceae bacterium]
MKKIEAIIRPEQIEDIKEDLKALNIKGISVSQIMGSGCQRGYREYVRGTEVDYNFLPKMKLELVVADEQVESVVQRIVETAKTGNIGDGKIFITDVLDAVRIRTGERGSAAIK